MPPWFADPGYAHLANERRLVDREIDDARRVGRQRRAGRRSRPTAPPPLTFNDGWNIKPDVIVEMPKPFDVPARGTVNYKYIVVKTNFPEDMWVTAAEMRPGDPAVLHHGKVWVRPPGSKWMEKARAGRGVRVREPSRHPRAGTPSRKATTSSASSIPGSARSRFDIGGAAKFVPKGSDLVFELHYTTSGQAGAGRLEARSRAREGGAADSATSSTPGRRR